MVDILEFIMSAGEKLVPPITADHEKQYQWRVRLAVVACSSFIICTVVLPFVLAMIFGAFPKLFDGFARSGEVQTQVAQVNGSVTTVTKAVSDLSTTYANDRKADNTDRLKTELLNLNSQHCHTPKGAARQIYADRLAELQDHFETLTGHSYALPACGDL